MQVNRYKVIWGYDLTELIENVNVFIFKNPNFKAIGGVVISPKSTGVHAHDCYFQTLFLDND
jgi:hypothetical protein